jgi:hypothetical protein
MLCDDQIYQKNSAIKDLRNQVKQHYSTESIFDKPYSYHHNQSLTTTDNITSKSPQYSNDKQLFEDWFKEELEYHFWQSLTKLTMSTMEGIENISGKEEKESRREAADKFLSDKRIDADTLDKFGHLRLRIIEYIGYQLRKESEEYKEKEDQRKRQQKADASARKINEVNKKQQNNSSKTDEENQFLSTWLSDRRLPQTAEDPNARVRKELSKWIDAKLFFHQLTHGKDSKTKIIDLDDYWKKSFAMGESEENLYKRYFNSLDPQTPPEWPEDFKTLLKRFQNFVEAP